jgi:hypothetical protein
VANTRGQNARQLRTEKLLVATGRKPNSDKIAIEKAGVVVGEKGQVHVGVFCISPQKGSIHDHAAKAVSVAIWISASSRTISSTLTGSGCTYFTGKRRG